MTRADVELIAVQVQSDFNGTEFSTMDYAVEVARRAIVDFQRRVIDRMYDESHRLFEGIPE